MNWTKHFLLLISLLSLTGCSAFTFESDEQQTQSHSSEPVFAEQEIIAAEEQPLPVEQIQKEDIVTEAILEEPKQSINTTEEPSQNPVVQLNNAPQANQDFLFTREDVELLVDKLLMNDSDIDDDTLQIASFSSTSEQGGVITQKSTTILSYKPRKDYYGVDTFTYTVSDGRGGESTAVVSIKIDPVNDIPIAGADNGVLNQNTNIDLDLLHNDSGLGDGIIVELMNLPKHGSATIDSNGILHYLPTDSYFGDDDLTYKVTDHDGDTAVANVQLTINCLTACTRTFTLSWDASVSNNVSEYKIYVGTSSNDFSQSFTVGNVLEYQYLADKKGAYYFAVSAINDLGIESALSTVESAVF